MLLFIGLISAFGYQWVSRHFAGHEAREAALRALELNPSYASARQWYGLLLLPVLGRQEEAIR